VKNLVTAVEQTAANNSAEDDSKPDMDALEKQANHYKAILAQTVSVRRHSGLPDVIFSNQKFG
jgi:hypothetical protein